MRRALEQLGYEVCCTQSYAPSDLQQAAQAAEGGWLVLDGPCMPAADLLTFAKEHPRTTIIVPLNARLSLLAEDPQRTRWLRLVCGNAYQPVPNLQIGITGEHASRNINEALDVKTVWVPYVIPPFDAPQCSRLWDGKVLRVGMFNALCAERNVFAQCLAAKLVADRLGVPLLLQVVAGERAIQERSAALQAIEEAIGQPNTVNVHPAATADIEQLVAKCDMLFHCPYTDGFAWPPVLAIARGVPFVASEALWWVPEELYVPAENCLGIADAAHAVFTAPEPGRTACLRIAHQHLEKAMVNARQRWTRLLS